MLQKICSIFKKIKNLNIKQILRWKFLKNILFLLNQSNSPNKNVSFK